MVTQAHNFDMTPGDQRLCRKTAAMSLRGPLVAGCRVFFTTAGIKSGSPAAIFTVGKKGREGVVDASDINKETLYNSSDCRHDDDDNSTFVSGEVDPREKSRGKSRLCRRSRRCVDETSQNPKLLGIRQFKFKKKMRKNAATPFCNNIGRNKTCLLHCEAELLLFLQSVCNLWGPLEKTAKK